MVGNLEPVQSLDREYATDEVYLGKVKDLASKYKYIRRTRPDGNCFFRAFTYAYIERLLEKRETFDAFYKLAEVSKNSLVELGFPQFTVEDFYDTVSVIYHYLIGSIGLHCIFLVVHGCFKTSWRH